MYLYVSLCINLGTFAHFNADEASAVVPCPNGLRLKTLQPKSFREPRDATEQHNTRHVIPLNVPKYAI